MSEHSDEEKFPFEEAEQFVEESRQRWEPIKIRRALIGSWAENKVPLMEQIERSAGDGVLELLRVETRGGLIGKLEVEAILAIETLTALEISDSNEKIDPAVMALLFEGVARHSNLNELTLQGYPAKIETEMLAPLSQGRLRSLELSGSTGPVIGRELIEVFAGIEGLTSLSILGDSNEIEVGDFSEIPSLANLMIRGRNGSNVSLAGIGRMEELNALRLVASTFADPQQLVAAPSLKELHLSCQIPELDGLNFLSGCNHLETLSLPCLPELDGEGLAVLGELAGLRSLRLPGTRGGSLLENLGRLKKLENLYLGAGRGCEFPEAKHFAAIREMESLSSLVLESYKVTDDHLAALAGHESLETLEFTWGGRCSNPLSKGLVDFVRKSPGLRNLNITGANIDDDCMLALADVGSNLQRIDLFDAAPVSQSALNAFRRKNPQCRLMSDPSDYCALKGETVFDFGHPQEVEFDQDEIDDLVARGAATVPRMTRFNPKDGRVTDLGLSYLRASQTLRWVDLENCPDVTLRGLYFLGECPNLKGVMLPAEGGEITDEEIRAFNERFPDVRLGRS